MDILTGSPHSDFLFSASRAYTKIRFVFIKQSCGNDASVAITLKALFSPYRRTYGNRQSCAISPRLLLHHSALRLNISNHRMFFIICQAFYSYLGKIVLQTLKSGSVRLSNAYSALNTSILSSRYSTSISHTQQLLIRPHCEQKQISPIMWTPLVMFDLTNVYY